MNKFKTNGFVDNIIAYKPGKSALDFGNKSLIKLSSNENPFGSAISEKELMSCYQNLERYTNTNENSLINAISDYHNVDKESILLGNGSDELFGFVAQAFLNYETEALTSDHTFSVYKSVTQIMGASYKTTPMKNYGYDLSKILDAVTDKTSVIFIANPNNPTGSFLTYSELASFLNKLPTDIVVVLDEAYKEYVQVEDPSKSLQLLAEYKNVIITRTFSKMYGLAGLRLGYAISSPEIISLLKKIKPPFNINSIALQVGVKALLNSSFVEKSYNNNRDGLTQFYNTAKELSVEILPSQANFICLINNKYTGTELFDLFAQEGYIIRDLTSFGLANGIRITIGSKHDVDACVKILNNFFN